MLIMFGFLVMNGEAFRWLVHRSLCCIQELNEIAINAFITDILEVTKGFKTLSYEVHPLRSLASLTEFYITLITHTWIKLGVHLRCHTSNVVDPIKLRLCRYLIFSSWKFICFQEASLQSATTKWTFKKLSCQVFQ